MKSIVLWPLLLLAASVAGAQPFLAEKVADLPEYEQISTEWGDMDGDGLLDLVIFAHVADQTSVYCLLQQDSVSFSLVQLPFGEQARLNFQLKDVDHDGALDIVFIAGFENGQLVIARNTGNLVFDLVEIDAAVNEFIINDLDRDGDEDLVVSAWEGDKGSHIFLVYNDTTFKASKSALEGLSLVSGQSFIEEQKLYCVVESIEGTYQLGYIQLEKEAFFFKKTFGLPASDVFDLGDLDHDGSVDIAMAIEHQVAVFYRNGDEYLVDELSGQGAPIVDISIGDVDLDGLADIVVTTAVELQANVYFFKKLAGGEYELNETFFELNHGYGNKLADINDDGDLDMMSLVLEGAGNAFYTQLNQTTILNKGPESVAIFPPVTIYDQTLFSWHKTGDDYTDTLAISYELFIEYDGEEVFHTMPGYDMDTTTRTGFRNVVGHGYRWFDTHYKAKSLKNGRYYWGVVGVDNAYYASSDIRKCKVKGPCIDFYTPINCLDLLVEDTIVCYNSTLVIDLQSGDDSVKWYSVKKGFLEESPILNYQVLEPDTIYGIFYPQIPCVEESNQCVLNYSIAIDVKKSEGSLFEKMVFCPETENIYSVEGEWDSVRWWHMEEIVARGASILLDSIPEKPIVAEAFKGDHCAVYDTLDMIQIDRLLDPGSLPDSIAACEGQPTQVHVFSDLDPEHFLYTWRPTELFDKPDLPNPFITTTEAAPVMVIVEQDKCYSDTITLGVKLLPLPEVTTNGDQEIFKGEKVLLIAEGAEEYSWSPETDLQSPQSGTTWGEPPATITYTVKGANGQGCYAESALTVIVRNSVFIPDLFSPNGDGANDFLHVYGEEIGTLSFRVFDERGSLMVELDEILNTAGWDGVVSGTELPSGTYFWTVSGEFTDGQPISYQGKNKGSIRLVR